MQRIWSADELGECWSLLPEDLALLAGRVDAGKLGFAVQLAFWRQHGRFPDHEADVAPAVITHLAAQIGVSVEALDGYAWVGRSGRRHRVAIIDHLSVAAFDEAAEDRFRRWLADDVLPREFAPSVLDEELSGWFARSRVTRPGAYRLGRIMRSAQAAYDDAALRRVAERLDIGMRERLGDELRAIKRHLATRTDALPWLFISERGQPLTRQAVNYLIAAAAERAGLPGVHPHTLRHSCGFVLADKGHDLRLIQDYLGHRDPRHTVHYTRTVGRRFEGLWR